MSEADYILVSTLTRVRAAREAIGHVSPANDATKAAIPADELKTVHRIVAAWMNRLEQQAEAARDAAGDDPE
jgi:hypothetical protein